MTRVTPQQLKPEDRDLLRRELLKRIVKNEETRRDAGKSPRK